MTRVAFKQCEVERLLRAAIRVGIQNPTVEKRPDGALRLLTNPAVGEPATSGADADLDAELEAWRRKHGDG